MRTVLLASDIHYKLRHFDWLLDVAADFDAVVLAGDHLDISAIAPLQAQCRGARIVTAPVRPPMVSAELGALARLSRGRG